MFWGLFGKKDGGNRSCGCCGEDDACEDSKECCSDGCGCDVDRVSEASKPDKEPDKEPSPFI